MKILICGDVMGKSGRRTVKAYIPVLKEKLGLDFVIVNGENAAHGFGITEKICREFFDLGVDVITTGNHVWDQREIMNFIGDEPRLLRPINYPKHTPGVGAGVFETPDGRKVTVIHPMGRLFMEALDDADAIIVDVHGEATSEKMAMGHFLDGRVSAVVGSHSHVPTADAQILPGGTAYQTDMGMCGDYDSVIGMLKERALARFTTKLPTSRLEPAEGEGTLCAVYVETNDSTGLAEQVYPVRVGGRLAGALPEGV
jgi:metallophosphoesterase (TIGR00282 family)